MNPITPHIDNIVSIIMQHQDGKINALHVLDLIQDEINSCYEEAEAICPRVTECIACHGSGRLRLGKTSSTFTREVLCKFCDGTGYPETHL